MIKILPAAALAVGACFTLACGDDDPAEQTGVAGGSSVELDASVRALPGDGREATPDFDTESRQQTPIGPQQLVENVNEVRNDIYGEPSGGPDAGPGGVDLGDGGAN